MFSNEEGRVINVNFFLNHIKLLFLDNNEKELYFFIKYQLGITPTNIHYYKKALTHKSASLRDVRGVLVSNERLEFLGDSVLDCVLAEYLFIKYPHNDEGYLTQMRSKVVNRKSLNDIALSIRLNKYIKATKLNADCSNALGNAFEALVGAIFLDKGFDCTKKFIVGKVLEKHYDFNFLEKNDTNFKSRLIEYAQKNKRLLAYETTEKGVQKKGKTLYQSVVTFDSVPFCSATGNSKKEAEQTASKTAIQLLNEDSY